MPHYHSFEPFLSKDAYIAVEFPFEVGVLLVKLIIGKDIYYEACQIEKDKHGKPFNDAEKQKVFNGVKA